MRASNGALICVGLIGMVAVAFYMSSHFSNKTHAVTPADTSVTCAGVTWNASDDQRKHAYKYRAVTTFVYSLHMFYIMSVIDIQPSLPKLTEILRVNNNTFIQENRAGDGLPY